MKKNRQQALNNKKRKQDLFLKNKEKEQKQALTLRKTLKERDRRFAALSQEVGEYRKSPRKVYTTCMDTSLTLDITVMATLVGQTIAGLNQFRSPAQENRRLNDPNTLDLSSDDYKEV